MGDSGLYGRPITAWPQSVAKRAGKSTRRCSFSDAAAASWMQSRCSCGSGLTWTGCRCSAMDIIHSRDWGWIRTSGRLGGKARKPAGCAEIPICDVLPEKSPGLLPEIKRGGEGFLPLCDRGIGTRGKSGRIGIWRKNSDSAEHNGITDDMEDDADYCRQAMGDGERKTPFWGSIPLWRDV